MKTLSEDIWKYLEENEDLAQDAFNYESETYEQSYDELLDNIEELVDGRHGRDMHTNIFTYDIGDDAGFRIGRGFNSVLQATVGKTVVETSAIEYEDNLIITIVTEEE